MQFLDPVLDFAALAVDLFVEPLRALLHVGNDEARVVFGLFAFAINHLGLDDDAAFLLPTPGRVVGVAVDMFGLSGNSGEYAGILHGLFRLALQHRVLGHRHYVFDAGLGIQKGQQARMRKAAIEANADAHGREKVADNHQQAAQNPHRACRCGHVAGAQHSRTQILFGFVVEADETHHRQVAPVVVVSVEEGQLLCPMSWIVGRIQIDGHQAGTVVQPLGMTLDHAARQRLAQTIELPGSDRVFKAR